MLTVTSDVLRRHFQTCKQKGDCPAPGQAEPGRRRTACNACVEARLFCDGEYPCETCLHRGIHCSFTHIQEPSGPVTRTRPTVGSPQSDRIPGPAKMAIPFLLHYADTGSDSELGSLRLLAQCGSGNCTIDHQSNDENMFETWESLFNSFINPSTLGPSCGIPAGPTDRFSSELLENTSTRLLSLLASSDRSPPDRDPPDLHKAEQLLSPRNIGNALEALLDNPFNAHFFHAASFHLNTASPRLILTMVLLGATYITPQNTTDLAQYSEVAEHLIFDDPEFQVLVHGQNHLPEHRILEILQSALYAMYLQTNHDNPTSIRRLRMQRFPAVITAIRTLNLTTITNDSAPSSSTWESHLLQEGLVRVMAGIHLFNYYCIMFYRHPTQLRITETTFEIPQRDDLFHARDAAEWERLYPMNLDDRAPDTMRLHTVLREYMRADHTNHDQGHYPRTLLGLFLVLSGLHSILFDLLPLHTITNDPCIFHPVERGLDRWKSHWDLLCSDIEPARAQRAGFIIHAVEYWWVAKALIRCPAAGLLEGRDDGDTRDGFRGMVERLGVGGGGCVRSG
ncbi:Zn(II)2Cys6 transcription factor domain-containing protein [Aspergillus ibericus CBS 121593]|uniref:Zn(2)-C6 fungal-type domain-containing protein n=1 Tax=Aspergillus ibericus CBS 121593 TaxID=1448316 RepID=A0A395GUU1_9EURO|nr:hypothetical protein BO80DRAFT_457097 [Aspergillus ibericus CBS 121593]RAK98768.1 hypothetical protein BO80DRAFT_457097 [Aspergillus ibericus CBS 121593]